jgi:hypothetical protein
MRNKLYFVASASEQPAIASACASARCEWHFHSIPPAHSSLLVVVMNPAMDLETAFVQRYLAFPELHDASEHISHAIVDSFPGSTGLSTADTTFSALKKIHAIHGMAGMHPKA